MKNIIVTLNKSISNCSSFFDEARDVSSVEDDQYQYVNPNPDPSSKAMSRAIIRGTGEDVSLDRQKIVPLYDDRDLKGALEKLLQSDDVEDAAEEIDVEPLITSDRYNNYYEGDKGGMNMLDISLENPGKGIVVAVLEISSRYGFLIEHRGFGWEDRWPEGLYSWTGNMRRIWMRNTVKYNMHPVFVSFHDSHGDFVDPSLSGDVIPGYGHGTMTASCIVGQGIDDAWGVAPDAKIMAAIGNLSQNIILSADQGADVISISYTGASYPWYFPSIDYAISQGVPVVWAHYGNKDIRNTNAYKPLIRVGTHDRLGRHWFSHGNVSLTAPGIGIRVNDPLSKIGTKKTGGQSLSTPLVAGIVGLLLQKNPNWKVADVYRALQLGAVKNTDDNTHRMDRNTYTEWYGWGMLNAGNALKLDIFA